MGVWEFDLLFVVSLEKKCLAEILLLFVHCFILGMILLLIELIIVLHIALEVGVLLLPPAPSNCDIRTSFSQLLHSTTQVSVQNHRICSFCMSLIRSIYHGKFTDHDDTSVR